MNSIVIVKNIEDSLININMLSNQNRKLKV